MSCQLLIAALDVGHGRPACQKMPAPTATSPPMWAGLRRRTQTSPYMAQFAADDDRAQGTCSYYPMDAGGCRAPRSCFDCLHAELEKELNGCMINEIGRCVSVTGNYDVSLDFRVASVVLAGSRSGNGSRSQLTTSQQTFELEFPAVNTTYCEDNDVLFNVNQLADAGFIQGTGGCVFVEVCEVPNWAYVVGGSDCSGLIVADYNGHRNNISGNQQGYLVFWCIAVAIILTLVATLAMVITIHHRHSKRRLEEYHRQRLFVVGERIANASQATTSKAGKSGGRLLNLFGWEAMRADLIEKERQDMQERICDQAYPDIENSLPGASPATNYLQLVGTEPSAPAMAPII